MAEQLIPTACSPQDSEDTRQVNSTPSASSPLRPGRFNSLAEFFDLPASTALRLEGCHQLRRSALTPGAIFHFQDSNSDLNGRILILLDDDSQDFKCLALRLVSDNQPIPSIYRRVHIHGDTQPAGDLYDLNCFYFNADRATLGIVDGQPLRLRSTIVVDIEAVYNVDFHVMISSIGHATQRSLRRLTEPALAPTSASVSTSRPSPRAGNPAATIADAERPEQSK